MSRDINHTILVGRLTRDPELKYTQNQTPVCSFSIASNRQGANGAEEVSFFDITTWSKVATSCSQYLKKGSQVIVEGRLQQSRFTDKTGANRSKIEVVAGIVQFLGGKTEGQSQAPTQEQPAQNGGPANNEIEFQDFDQTAGGSDEVPF